MEPRRGERKSVKRARLEISGSINLWNETERVQQRCARTRARGSIQRCCYSRDVSLVINHSDKSALALSSCVPLAYVPVWMTHLCKHQHRLDVLHPQTWTSTQNGNVKFQRLKGGKSASILNQDG